MSVYADGDQSLWLLALCIGAADYTAQEPGRLYVYRRSERSCRHAHPNIPCNFFKAGNLCWSWDWNKKEIKKEDDIVKHGGLEGK
jgi:hypothetical protein